MVLKKKLFINGEWIEASSYTTLTSPYSEEVLAEIPSATEQEVNDAIEAAYNAREIMAKMPAHKRAAILEKLVSLFEERADEAAKIIALEAAKPITTAKQEVSRTIATYKFAAEEAKRIHGETIPLDAAPGGENRIAYTVREPLGVVGAITPFNFPMNLVAHKVGPAIAAGNPIVLKPASQTPLSSYFLAELLEEAGLPAGALNVVTGSGRVVGDKLVTDDRVKVITFTGSPAVGIGIRNKAGLKRVTLELGSNAALIIDNGVDVDKVINRTVVGAFSNQGQVCISLQRIYVHENVYDVFVEKFVAATKNLKVGDPLDPQTDVSALISKGDVGRTLEWIEEAKQNGAEIATGGIAEGNVLLPTVVLYADKSLKVSCQEVFAPIVNINKVSSVAEAIELVNDSRYGLQAGIYTDNVHTALDAAEKLHVGGVMINDIPTFRVDNMPYGGVKESGVGREGIKYAVEEMTEMKLVVFNRN
ncbi:NAD-dependent aldehyde dehydrogenase [Schinkia azotoformans MEV2011]|uniref:NAD-dependent aldehyde dehydrogenase n=1 Tax=Schinkia azotoformans MEV2011 TaxID=1348973 RepID=A0A072NKS6_SCHAZ|nr:aldehyde dehydrogenase family protein [Schinkia azotoformans]KEF37518.1 NAD-dependent aldehyde dehydrogenase [Schinkia azotoformans MEV2011]MEC1697841.1 aldehyde dehydrogenase family protein [Schinkia azotoformans]MEC1726255.1 aldehyde dehydrogenase family protein [Schinkia azotoformans]MEC1770435.1 aldehyde dehydrogenase family protein [Schinkia azotoformans]MEC1780157.1 aldehyde dehydrogenase family protein [Schinkia azotoformans]